MSAVRWRSPSAAGAALFYNVNNNGNINTNNNSNNNNALALGFCGRISSLLGKPGEDKLLSIHRRKPFLFCGHADKYTCSP